MAQITDNVLALRKVLEMLVSKLSDEEALECISFSPAWNPCISYTAGQRIRYNNALYKVLQAHTSQSDWTPDKAPSLFAKVLMPEDGAPKEWVQPDSTNAYAKGDKVLFEGKTYESLIDNNVWSPAAYPAGWKETE